MSKRLGLLLAVLGLATFVLAGCGGGEGGAGGTQTITMSEFAFEPDSISIPAGEEVTLEFVNDGATTHEFLAGREVTEGDNGRPDGFEEDLFEGVDVTVEPSGARMGGEEGMEEMEATEMATEMATGMATDDEHAEDEHAGHGVGVVVEPGETASMTFTLPADRAGEWMIGCFEDNGTHYEQGMDGTLTVTE